VFRVNDPKTATLIFESGKMVITGAKSEEKVCEAVNAVVKELQGAGVLETCCEPIIEVQNMVASASLGVELDLEKAAYTLTNVMYETEQFPGLIYRMKKPKVVLLLFSTGNIVCTGAKREEEVSLAVNKLLETVMEQGIIKSRK
jgi:transcription initiation factor TFIID TATA-box-binding protein